MNMLKKACKAAQDTEDKVKSAISELFLLLKSDTLTDAERDKLKVQVDEQIQVLERTMKNGLKLEK